MKLIYIAGPYTEATRWEIKQNIQYARAVAAQVIRIAPGQRREFDCGFGTGLYAKDDGQALVPA